MVMQVNKELCAGCSVCVEICPVGAIQFVDKRAWIDTVICTACEACMEACPNEAIYPSETLEHHGDLHDTTCARFPTGPISSAGCNPGASIPYPRHCAGDRTMLAYLGREAASAPD